MLLPAARVLDRELRAVEPERRSRHRGTRERDLEADARGVRGAAHGRGDEGGAKGVRRSAAYRAGRLTMATVGEVMSRNLLTVDPTTGLSDAARQMSDRGVGAALVLSGESVSGILTERDVLRAVATGGVEGTHVAAWMTRDPETVDAAESTGQAAAVMIHGGFRHLPVVEADRPVGIVSIRDLMRVVVDDESPRGV